MPRWLVVVLVLLGVAALGAGASFVPRLRESELFRVRAFRVEGGRYLTSDQALAWAGVAARASVWDDPSAWEAGLRADPLVVTARVERELPHTLVFRVKEREPVALLPRPVLVPVDSSGRVLPLDPAAARLDLPLIRPVREGDDRPLTPVEVKDAAAELGRLGDVDPRFLSSVSEVEVDPDDALVAELMKPAVAVRFRPPLTSGRLQEGLRALSDAMERTGGSVPRSVDLRFDDQVVVRFGTATNVTARQSD